MGEASWAQPKSFAKTFNGTASALSETSLVADEGYIVKALSTNTAAAFLGGSDVTTGNGLELLPSEWVSVSGAELAKLFGVTAGASQEVRVLKL